MVEEAQVERNALDRGKADDTPSVNGLLRTAMGWGIGWGVVWSISLTAVFAYGILLSNIIATTSDVRWLFAISTAMAVAVASSTFLTSRALRRTEPSIKRQQALMVATGWAISFIIGLAVGGTIPWFVLSPVLPIWTIVAWAIAVAIGGGALMFWQLGRVRPAPKAPPPRSPVELRVTQWIYGRWAVLFLLLIGFFGPWTSCNPCLFGSCEKTYTGLQLLWHFNLIVAPFVAPILLLFIVTLLRLLWNSTVAIWLERFAAAGSLIISGLVRPWDDTWFWGFRVTVAGILLAVLNLIGELITTRRRRL